MCKYGRRLKSLFSGSKDKNKNNILQKGLKASISIPFKEKKEIILLDPKWLSNHKQNIKYLILHHSTTKDGRMTKDWDAIDIYHRSFRINWNIEIRPVTNLILLSNIRKGREKSYMKIYNSWYDRVAVIAFYQKVQILLGEELEVPQYISKYEGGAMIETPWRKGGYNLGSEWADGKLSLRYGRNLRERGAHCYQDGMNGKSIGYLIMGNYDRGHPDGEMWRHVIKVVREVKIEFPNIKILGHREVRGVRKSCPGELWNMIQFRKDLEKTII